jgi:radical SAM superfamily enzyme YgiQ (UPF0313 family)
MRVLLVNTNRMKPAIAPIGLDYLYDVLLAEGHEVCLLDLCFSEDALRDIDESIASFDPEVVGVSVRNTDDCYFSGQAFFLPEIKQFTNRLRQSTSAPIVLGGVGFSVSPWAVMDFLGVDYGIAGEGEISFPLLLRALCGLLDWGEVPNLICKANGGLVQTRRQFADLNKLPVRSRSLVDNARYFREGGQAGFETKRGCAMKCIYCADPVAKGRLTRLLPAEMVVREIRVLLDQGIDHFHTCDSEFNLPADHAKDVCRAVIDAGLGDKIRWYAYCSVTPFDDEMAGLFKESGCAGVDFGADSGCDAVLQSLGRHFRAVDLEETARLCRKHRIPFMCDLLIGGPGETRETIRETIDLMRRIDADCVGVAMGVRIYEGTALARQVLSEGDMASNPNLYVSKFDNPHFLKPVFYVSPTVGAGIVDYLRDLVGGDKRFFLPSNEVALENYNYNDNPILVNAIRDGARGAYWDILRRL